MGCGGSKNTTAVATAEKAQAVQDTTRVKTPSLSSSSSSSSGVSSYRQSQLLQAETGNSQDLHQSRPGQESQEAAVVLLQNEQQQQQQQQLLAEQQKREKEEAAAEAEKQRLQEKARAEEKEKEEEEERRRLQQAGAEEAGSEEAGGEEAGAAGAGGEETGAGGEEVAGSDGAETKQEEVSTQHNQGQVSDQKGGGRFFTPPEIAQHNAAVKWCEWIPHKGKVYDGNGVRSYFPEYVNNREELMEARRRQRVAEGGEEEETEFVTYVVHILNYSTYLSLRDPMVWIRHGIVVLRRNGITEEELDKELPPFLLGTITGSKGPAYYDHLRQEIVALLEELHASPEDSETPAVQEYTAQLIRWQDKYKHVDPDLSPAPDGTDPNEKSYPLPVDPNSLRLSILEGEPLDFEVLPEGAWQSYALEETDLGDPHEIFSASLRVDFSTEELLFDIEGDAAWDVLSDSAIKEGVMTPQQEEVQAARDKRTDLNDLERMKRRRQELSDYFIEDREMAPDVVLPFLQWASLMEAGQAQLDKLCQEG